MQLRDGLLFRSFGVEPSFVSSKISLEILLVKNVAFEMNDIRPSAAMSRTSNLRYDPVQAFITISGVQPRIPTMRSPLNHMHQKMTLGPPYTASLQIKREKT